MKWRVALAATAVGMFVAIARFVPSGWSWNWNEPER